MKLAALAATMVIVGSPLASGVNYLQAHELGSGAFAEPGGSGYPQLTAWAVLGLRAAGASPRAAAAGYLVAHEAELTHATDIALVLLAEAALRQSTARLVPRLRSLAERTGAIGGLVNATAWSVLALRAAGAPVPRRTLAFLLSRQGRAGGWGWSGPPADSNDTAAALEALCALQARGRPVARGLRFLSRFRNGDGGFGLTLGAGSDAQSTAWVIQAFLAAGRRPPRGSLAYLRRLQRPDGSFRYSARYLTTPLWVTAQVLPALAREPFPLR
ncbi:MAG TPA: hypothetical protein VF002_08495 [Gaiellaceae bacterium]